MSGMITLFILLLTILFHISLLLNIVIAVNPSGFSMKMFHKDSKESPFYPGDHLTQDERFQRLVKQSKGRARYIGQKILSLRNSINPDVVRLPIIYEDVGSSYVALMGIGTFGLEGTPMRYYLMVDTGSELIWIQCDGGDSYFAQQQPRYPATHSITYTPLPCREQPGGRIFDNPFCYRGLCSNEGLCTYHQLYQDDAETSGILAIEKFTVSTDTLAAIPIHLIMGCGFNQVNFDSDGPPEVGAGILGLNGERKSFLTQLNLGKFEYCLRPYRDGAIDTSTYLRFGTDTILDRGFRRPYRTPLLYHEGHYLLDLKDISVNGRGAGFASGDLGYDRAGNGGCLIDSGTVLTQMQGRHLDKVEAKVREHFRNFGIHPVIPSPVDDFDLCFQSSAISSVRGFEYPKITFHFQDANFELRKDEEDTSFWTTDNGYVCLGLLRPDGDIPYAVMFGAMQQARKRILHDVAGGYLYFDQEDCRYDNMRSI